MDNLHRYANDELGNRIFIENVTQETRHRKFYCKNCGGLMIPVLGKYRKPHFRHKVVTPTCSYENYIHKIGKEIIKERFYKQDSFIVSYYVGFNCEKSNVCKFRDRLENLGCNNREKRSIDLKQLYNTCEVEKKYKGFKPDLILTHSEHPEREPIFIEIAYSHECEPPKLESKIQIIEVKVKDDQDFSMQFEEPNLLFLNFDGTNPYSYHKAPPVRFYNFHRQVEFSIPLKRFIVFKTKEGTIEGFDIPYDTTCQDFENEHYSKVDYEFVTSEEIMEKEQRNNIYAYGMAVAIKKGYKVKHCVFCRRFNKGNGGCLIYKNQEFVDTSTGEIFNRQVPVWNVSLKPKELDRASIAAKCNNFLLDYDSVQRFLNMFKNVPYWDYENKEKK